MRPPGSITEHGLLSIKPGQEEAFEAAMTAALPLIACQPGFLGIRVLRCLERVGAYLLLVEWVSVEAHEEGFRRSAEYADWRAALHPFYDPFPAIEHYAVFAASGPGAVFAASGPGAVFAASGPVAAADA